ncbi:MAG: transposase [Planctomycetes bacterium RIFOXYB12_FULL_42_10]|nr:MAG: transposase [Planctomycetes bacterium RIFOXYB12_FULL_42_10]
MKNKYANRSKISESKIRQLLKHFALDLDAQRIAVLCNLNRNTVNRYLNMIRIRIAEFCEQNSPFRGEIEVDESYFGARRQKGKRGRGAYGKTPVFGILQRGGEVYTEIVPNCAKATLQAIIRGKVSPESIIHSDQWRGYNGLVDIGYEKHYRVKHGDDEFVNNKSHINGIESFWSYSKRRLQKFHGVPQNTFYLHLKECEFRFNHRNENIYAILLKMIRQNALF